VRYAILLLVVLPPLISVCTVLFSAGTMQTTELNVAHFDALVRIHVMLAETMASVSAECRPRCQKKGTVSEGRGVTADTCEKATKAMWNSVLSSV